MTAFGVCASGIHLVPIGGCTADRNLFRPARARGMAGATNQPSSFKAAGLPDVGSSNFSGGKGSGRGYNPDRQRNSALGYRGSGMVNEPLTQGPRLLVRQNKREPSKPGMLKRQHRPNGGRVWWR